MPKVRIELPPVEADDNVEVEVTVNGRKRRLSYRIEIFDWEEYAQPEDDRVTCLKRMLSTYDEDWQLVQLGEPSESEISILFQRRTSAPQLDTSVN